MIYCKGTRGRSKRDVRLSVDLAMGAVWLHVWENGKITHSFTADRAFVDHVANCAKWSDTCKATTTSSVQENDR